MIHMQITPPHPFLFRHLQKYRMRPPLKIPRPPRESLEHPPQLPHIRRKLRRPGPADLLIHLRHRFHSVRPTQRRIQRHPFHEPSPKCTRLHSQRLLPHHSSKRIAQMTNHLVHRHLPPSPLTVHPHPPHPLGDLFPIFRIPQCFHRLLLSVPSAFGTCPGPPGMLPALLRNA